MIDENGLIQSARLGNLDAFNQLVLAYQDLVYQHSLFILGEREAAEDITQEVFLRAYRSIGRFRDGSLRAWLLKIATNACYDELRRLKRHPVQSLEWGEDCEDEPDPADHLSGFELTTEQHVEQAELNTVIQRCMAELPAEYRSVAVLVDLLGFDYAEAAASLGIPQGTVKSRLSRARQGLRRKLLRTPEMLPIHYHAT